MVTIIRKKNIYILLSVLCLSLLAGCSFFRRGGSKPEVAAPGHVKAFITDRDSSSREPVSKDWVLPLRHYASFRIWSLHDLISLFDPIRSSSPVIAGNDLYVGSGNNIIYSFDLSKKKKIWYFKASGSVETTPAVDSERVYFGTGNGLLYSLDRVTGKEQWRFQAKSEIISSPLVSSGILYAASADNHIYALKADDGTIVWEYSEISVSLVENRMSASSVGLFDGRLYQLLPSGYLVSLDAYSGRRRWRKRIFNPSVYRYNAARRTPVVRGDKLYILGDKGRVFEMDPESGVVLRKFDETEAVDFLVYGDNLLLVGKNEMISLDLTSETVKWRKRLNYILPISITNRGRYMFVISNRLHRPLPFGIKWFSEIKGSVEVLDLYNGKSYFDKGLDSTISAAAAVQGKFLAVVADEGFVIVYRPKG